MIKVINRLTALDKTWWLCCLRSYE